MEKKIYYLEQFMEILVWEKYTYSLFVCLTYPIVNWLAK